MNALLNLLYLIFLFAIPSLLGDSLSSRSIYLVRPVAYDVKPNEEYSEKLHSSVKSAFKNIGITVLEGEGKDLKRHIENSTSLNADFMFSVYYTRNRLGNIEFYTQVIDPKTGYVIDAFSLRDNLEIYSEMELDPTEFRMDDSKREEQFFDPGIRVADGNFYPTMHPLERRYLWLTPGVNF